MMRGLELPSGEIAGDVIHHAYANGLVIESAGPDDEVVKCLAALTISREEMHKGLVVLADAVAAAAAKSSRKAA